MCLIRRLDCLSCVPGTVAAVTPKVCWASCTVTDWQRRCHTQVMRLREDMAALMDTLVRTKVELAETQGAASDGLHVC